MQPTNTGRRSQHSTSLSSTSLNVRKIQLKHLSIYFVHILHVYRFGQLHSVARGDCFTLPGLSISKCKQFANLCKYLEDIDFTDYIPNLQDLTFWWEKANETFVEPVNNEGEDSHDLRIKLSNETYGKNVFYLSEVQYCQALV